MLSSTTPPSQEQSFSRALPVIILFISFLSLPLATAQELGLSAAQTTSWILVLYGLPGVLSVGLSWHFRQPILLTGNVFILIFIVSLGSQIAYAELIGATLVAGIMVIALTWLGVTRRLLFWIPSPIIFGVLAGAIVPFISGIFTALNDSPVLIGGAFLAYLVSYYLSDKRFPPVLMALISGVMLVFLTESVQLGSIEMQMPMPVITLPSFSLNAISTATPIFIVLITLQANVPSLIFMQTQNYVPPTKTINFISGLATSCGAFWGPMGVSLSLPATSLLARSQEDGQRSVYWAGAGAIIIGLLSSLVILLIQILPATLLLGLAGLALVNILNQSLQHVVGSPLVLGPIFAFTITLSQISLLGLGPIFWALVIGTIVSTLMEHKQLKQMHAPTPASDPANSPQSSPA